MTELRRQCIELTGSAPDWKWEDIERARSFLSDTESRNLYTQEILYKAVSGFPSPISQEQENQAQHQASEMLQAGKLPTLASPSEYYLNYCLGATFVMRQYEYGDIVRFERKERLYDCGACLGDVSVQCVLNGGSAVAFEPVPDTAVYLEKNAAQYGSIRPVQIGVGDKNEHRMMTTKDNIGSNHILDCGDTLVELRPIDCLVYEYGVPTFIKMDLEGYEVPALLGARETIIRHRPKLAICLYHKPSDMWEIPLLLKEYVPEYRMYCKKSGHLYEFVLFCVI